MLLRERVEEEFLFRSVLGVVALVLLRVVGLLSVSTRFLVFLSGEVFVRDRFSLTEPRVSNLSVVLPRVVRTPEEDLPPITSSVKRAPLLLPPVGRPLPTVLAP